MSSFIILFRPFAVALFLILGACNNETGPDVQVEISVLDIGAGLASVIKIPGDYYVVYDTGYWGGGGQASFDAISAVIPSGEEIDLLVLSHSDSDHIGATVKLLGAYTIKKIYRTGMTRTSQTWLNANAAIATAVASGLTEEINLTTGAPCPIDTDGDGTPETDICPGGALVPGTQEAIGGVTLTFLSGFADPSVLNGISSSNASELHNAGSIVMLLEFGGAKVLFTGDAVGCHITDANCSILGTEEFLVGNATSHPIRADILIAPHHGSHGASSTDFIQAVSAKYVIFPAGHANDHPRDAAVQRYITTGVGQIFRTDLGDDEGTLEWACGRISGSNDPIGDDDVIFSINHNGGVAFSSSPSCP